MIKLLEDILTIGKSEARKIKVVNVRLDLKEFIETLIEEVKTTVKENREIIFKFSCAHSSVHMDDKLLRNIIINLLTNALRFSSVDTKITIAVADIGEHILIEDMDEGIGIDTSELESAFESFHRSSRTSAV